eukprot:g5634.t1
MSRMFCCAAPALASNAPGAASMLPPFQSITTLALTSFNLQETHSAHAHTLTHLAPLDTAKRYPGMIPGYDSWGD